MNFFPLIALILLAASVVYFVSAIISANTSKKSQNAPKIAKYIGFSFFFIFVYAAMSLPYMIGGVIQ